MKGFDPNAMFAQAKKMKDEMGRIQDDLSGRMVEGHAAGGVVCVVLNGNSEIQAVTIKPEAVDLEDLSMLEDLVTLAFTDAQQKATKMHEDAMQKATGGLGDLGGLF